MCVVLIVKKVINKSIHPSIHQSIPLVAAELGVGIHAFVACHDVGTGANEGVDGCRQVDVRNVRLDAPVLGF